MKEKLDALIDFQALEADILRVQTLLQQIPGTLEALDSSLTVLQNELAEKTASLNELKKQYRSKEAEEKMNLSRIKKSQERMDSVKTNKEYQSLLKEIQDIEEKNSLIEDEMLADLDLMEESEKTVQRLKKEMVEVEKQVEEKKIVVIQKAEALKQRQLELEQQLKTQSEVVDPVILDTFIRVKSRVGPMAIVPVHNAVCKGCHLMIPPQMYNELHRQDSLKFCPHCHRMIYWAAEE